MFGVIINAPSPPLSAGLFGSNMASSAVSGLSRDPKDDKELQTPPHMEIKMPELQTSWQCICGKHHAGTLALVHS